MPRLSDLIDVVVSTKRISNAKDHSAKLPKEVLTPFGKMFFQNVSRPVVKGTFFPCHCLFYLLTYDSMILAVTHTSAEFSSLIDNLVIKFFRSRFDSCFNYPRERRPGSSGAPAVRFFEAWKHKGNGA